MDDTYNFRAPQYVDFLNAVHDNEETDFFDYDLDTGAPLNKESDLSDHGMEEPATPYQDAESSYTTPQESPEEREEESPVSRIPTSARQFSLPRRSIFDGIEVEPPQVKAHSMKTRLDRRTKTPRLDLRSRSIVRGFMESPNMDGQNEAVVNNQNNQTEENNGMDIDEHNHEENGENNKQEKRKRKHAAMSQGPSEEPPAKFISMAEHIRKLQKQTPARFHTRPRFDGVTKKKFGAPSVSKHITIPHTPALVSHLRTRPVHALTREEEELREYEEAQKAKFKAAPLKENALKPHKVVIVEKKPPTEVKPFKLTEFKPKQRVPDEAPVVFKARPVPKVILSGPKVDLPKRKKVEPVPPPLPKVPTKHTAAPVKMPRTEIQPFSFDNRELGQKEKREKMMKEKEEMDRKLREFKARPPPTKLRTYERVPKRFKPKEEETPATVFKARSPTVLRQAPFVPLKTPRSPLQQKPFNLNSVVRAKEREKFDLIIKEKELKLEMAKREIEEEEARRLAEEIAKKRRDTVHHAKPVPQYKPFEVQPSHAPLTDPHSPAFIKRLRDRKTAKADQLNTTFDVES